MCGFAGIISYNTNDLQNDIVAMCDIIKHRGPDTEGYYYGNNFAFGHRRLAIIDLSDKGRQPMIYENQYVIIYNGEIFNYLELKSELEGKGLIFKSDTDTEVIMAAYDNWGTDCLQHFNGMFAFALYDMKKQNIFCARDRFGVKPFYYTQVENRFVFASEIKQFTVLKDWKAVANKNRLIDFLYSGGVHDHTNETLFDKVFQLQGGEFLVYNLTSCNYVVTKWYNLNRNSPNSKSNFAETKTLFRNLFKDTVKMRLRSDVKVGSCLSGGLDSSSIVCAMNDILKAEGKEEQQETVSSCFEDKKVDEREYIKEIIKKTNVASHKIFPSYKDLFPQLDKIVWHQDEPFGSTAVFAQWCVYEEARKKGIIVMLDGQGADEHLAGYADFHQVHFRELLFKGKILNLIRSLKNYRTRYKDYYYDPYKPLLIEVGKSLLPGWLVKFVSNKLIKTSGNNTFDWLKITANDGSVVENLNKKYSKTIKSTSEGQLLYLSLPKLLHHQDRNSMAHSVESRAPFVDYRLVEFVFGLPSEYKVKIAVTKYILREALKGLVPDKILNRYDKLGFATPQDSWFHENVNEISAELENACDNLQNYVDKDKILLLYKKAVMQKSSTSLFWRLICTSRWIKIFNVTI
ncbi:MAG: asparagine synthase (glutamine-hydrolyzing) [Bacteroidales bacterium]|nr:asparagine synthase (glutamine-hydrolyzing) [Bacteroidales bacterium]